MPSQLPVYMIHRFLTICWTPPDQGQEFYADTAYTGKGAEEIYVKKKVVDRVNEKGYRNRPLTDTRKKSNREKSRVRARVEHIFGFVENRVGTVPSSEP